MNHKCHDKRNSCCCHRHKEQPDATDLEKEASGEQLHQQEPEESSPHAEPTTGQAREAEGSTGETTEEYRDKYLRLLAENENLRRRLQKESQEAIRYATQKVILDLLEPYDNFEKALFHAGYNSSEEVRNWAIGFKMIHQQFKEWLSAQGVHSYMSKGEPFNPQLHEAVEMIPTRQFPEGIVIEELFKGYKMHDKVLRPAKVSIAASLSAQESSVQEAESELSEEQLKAARDDSPSHPT